MSAKHEKSVVLSSRYGLTPRKPRRCRQDACGPVTLQAGMPAVQSVELTHFALLFSVHYVAVVFEWRRGWICDRVCESLSLHLEVASVPFVESPGKKVRTAKLLIIS